MNVIQARVDPPTGIGRIPRKIATSFGGFTAEQWKNWVILYSMFALKDLLPHDHYLCWHSFVLACFYLSKKTISDEEIKKADLLLLKCCKAVEELYGKDTITPNIHLHAHMSECLNDYSSVYKFWLFSFETYNGILGSYPTNKRNIASQLMQKFIHEIDSQNRALPDLFKEEFKNVFALISPRSEDSTDYMYGGLLTGCSLPELNSIVFKLPSAYKTDMLECDDYQSLKASYAYLYGCNVSDDQVTKSIKIFKSITLYGQFFGSVKYPQTQYSAYIMASWSDFNGAINEENNLRPGNVMSYITHHFKVQNEQNYREHVFAQVAWFAEHPSRLHYGKPLEIWSKELFQMAQPISCLFTNYHPDVQPFKVD